MKENILEQLNYELNEQLNLINKKKMMVGYLWSTKNQQGFSEVENQNILGAMISISTAKNLNEYEYYSNNVLAYVQELLS